MKRDSLPSDDSWESDAVWKLLDQVKPPAASPRFVQDTVRAAKLMTDEEPLWKRWFVPASVGGLLAVSAAITIAVIQFDTASVSIPEVAEHVPVSETFAAIQDAAETEALLGAADHLDDFSDNELVSLIGLE